MPLAGFISCSIPGKYDHMLLHISPSYAQTPVCQSTLHLFYIHLQMLPEGKTCFWFSEALRVIFLFIQKRTGFYVPLGKTVDGLDLPMSSVITGTHGV